jgi:NADH:ubiquinone oxidoreductase subunit 2 (subunit N)
MFYYLRVIWAMYFVEAQPATGGETVLPSTPAPAMQAATGSGGVAVAEPATETRVAPAATIRRAAAPVHPATWVGLVVAAALTLGLGIVPGALVQLADQAARVLFR